MQGAIVGLIFGTGLLVVLRAFAPADRSLASALDRLNTTNSLQALNREKHWYSPLEPLFRHRMFAGWFEPMQPDLEVVGRSSMDFGADLLARMCVGVLVTMVGLVLLPAAGYGGFYFPLGFGLLLGLGGVIYAIGELKANAKVRRQEFLEAMAAYMEFIRLGSTFRGMEGSIWIGATAGSGWAFEAVQVAIEDSQRRGEVSWDGLRRLGERFGVTELEDLASTVSTAAIDGASVRDALEARTRSLRARLLAQEIAAANSSTAKLQGPIAIIGVIVFGLVLVPAMANIAGA